MNFQEIAEKYELVDTTNAALKLTSYTDPGDNSLLVHWDEEESQAEFDLNCPVQFNDDGSVTVISREGVQHSFYAYATRKVHLSNDPRAISVSDCREAVEMTDVNRMWVKVGKFDVLLNHTDEGIVVDVWPWVEKDSAFIPDEPLATCYAFDADADDAVSPQDEEVA